MLCIGGPWHGRDVECERDFIEVPVPIRSQKAVWIEESTPTMEPQYRTQQYNKFLIRSGGQIIPILVMP